MIRPFSSVTPRQFHFFPPFPALKMSTLVDPTQNNSLTNSKPIIRVGATATVIRESPSSSSPDYEFLLIQRGKFPMKNFYALPGGSIKFSETIQQAARRELFEECNIQNIQIIETIQVTEILPAVTNSANHFILVHTLCQRLSREQQSSIKAGDDAINVRWLTRDQIVSMNKNVKSLSLEGQRGDISSDLELIVPNVLEVVDSALSRFKKYYENEANKYS